MMADEAQELRQTELNAQIASAQEVKEQREVAYYMQLIKAKVQRFLQLPPSSDKSLHTVIEIRLMPDGEVISANIVKSSGMARFDEAALEAIRDARNLPVPQDIGVFRGNFARFNAVIRPGDIDI